MGTTPTHDFYIQPPSAPVPAFPPHGPNLLTSAAQFSQDLSKAAGFDISLRPVLPSPLEQLSMRISPISNSASPPSRLSFNAQETKIHSTVDQSSASEQSDDEDIDVVKSAFVPIKPANVILQEIQHPDSTVQDKESPKVKCELKAPSSRTIKNLSLSPEAPNTKIHGSSIVNTTKSVWRPY